MNEGLIIDDVEDYAFYQSGLSADGCLEKLDDYTRKAIKRYGEILLEEQKEDFIKGFKGCCYCCEPVAEQNQKLEKELEKYKYILDKNKSEEMLFQTDLNHKIKTLEKLLEQRVKDAEEFQEMSIKELARAEEYKFAVEEQKKYIKILEEKYKKSDSHLQDSYKKELEEAAKKQKIETPHYEVYPNYKTNEPTQAYFLEIYNGKTWKLCLRNSFSVPKFGLSGEGHPYTLGEGEIAEEHLINMYTLRNLKRIVDGLNLLCGYSSVCS